MRNVWLQLGAKMMKLAIALCLALPVVSNDAYADRLMQAKTIAEVLITRDDGGFSVCGIRVVAIIDQGKVARASDFSVYFSVTRPYGFAKFASWNVNSKSLQSGSASLVPVGPRPTSFWIGLQHDGKGAAATQVMAAQTPSYSLGIIPPRQAADLISSMGAGMFMHYSITQPEQDNGIVGWFSLSIRDQEAQSLRSCIDLPPRLATRVSRIQF